MSVYEVDLVDHVKYGLSKYLYIAWFNKYNLPEKKIILKNLLYLSYKYFDIKVILDISILRKINKISLQK